MAEGESQPPRLSRFSILLEWARVLAGHGLEGYPKDRLKAEGKAVEMTEQIKADTFDYLRWFPKGNKAHEFGAKPQASAPAAPLTVRKFYEEWIEKETAALLRIGLQRNYQQDFTKIYSAIHGRHRIKQH